VTDGRDPRFFINLPIGIAAIVLGRRWIPAPTSAQHGRQSLDPVGVLLLGSAVLLLLLPLVQEREWHGQGKWLLVAAAFAVLAGFVVWERRSPGTAHQRRPLGPGLFRTALIGTLGFVLIALAAAVFDVLAARRAPADQSRSASSFSGRSAS
jgi:hypothetical protein